MSNEGDESKQENNGLTEPLIQATNVLDIPAGVDPVLTDDNTNVVGTSGSWI